MKKILIVGLLLAGNGENLQASTFAELMASSSMVPSGSSDGVGDAWNGFFDGIGGGNANNIIYALGEDPGQFEEFGQTGVSAGSNNWNVLAYRPAVFTARKSPETIEKEARDRMAQIGDYYLKMTGDDVKVNVDKTLEELNKDIRALDAEAKIKNSSNKKQLESFLYLAKRVSTIFAKMKMQFDSAHKLNEYKPTSGKSLAESLAEAEANLHASPDKAHQASYQAVITHLKAIQGEVQKFKRSAEQLKITSAALKLAKALEFADKALTGAENALRSQPKSLDLKKKVDIIKEAIEQLKLEQVIHVDLNTVQETEAKIVKDRIALEYPEINKDDNPKARLEKAEGDLNVMRTKLDSMKRYTGGYSMQEIEAQEADIEIQRKVIGLLQGEQKAFDVVIARKMKDLLKNYNMDAKKALDKLTGDADKSIYSATTGYLSNMFTSNGKKIQDEKIKAIPDSHNRAVAEQLQMQILQSANQSQANPSNPSSSAYSQLSGASDAEGILGSLNAMVNDTLAKTGSKIPAHKQGEVKMILEKTRDRLLVMSQKTREVDRPALKNQIVTAMLEELKALLSIDFIGVNYAALQTRDPLTIGVDVLLNKLLPPVDLNQFDNTALLNNNKYGA
jgi:hypothetical protein